MDLLRELGRVVDPTRVLARSIDRVAFANDASVYRLVPRAVVLPESVAEVRGLFEVARRTGLGLTFRAAGTSLSGQAVTDGILAVVSRHWREVEVQDGGARVRVQPGVIGGLVNQLLERHGRKIGPDPASINACMIGGILANNSSGMCCGVEQNAYRTLRSMRFVLPRGLELDTARPDARARLAGEAPDIAGGLLDLKRRLEADAKLRERVRAKYRLKNTTGYSLNAFLDFAEPLDILTHLMIGSEGTLGFIAEAVLDTVPDDPLKHTGLLFFPDVPRACSAIAPLCDSGARALELMDRASLRAIEDRPGVPPGIRELPAAAAALLVEYQCTSEADLAERVQAGAAVLPRLPLLAAPEFTRDPARQAALWSVRKGLIPSVGALRRRGTSFIIEDVVFPVERLAAGVTELQDLFARHGYDDAIVFGHAKDGNLHFVLTQAFERAEDVARYDAFMRDLAVLVVERHDGALKAEHGTGRNMAPFVATEWGEEACRIMRGLKRLIDPDGILNPGVILNDDPAAHVTHLKPLPTVETEVDACIECGFCERHCPSRDLTLTPRQRIVVRREMSRLRDAGDGTSLLAELERDYRYAALDTCATDGLCATACPVGIDTGLLVKRLRGASCSATRHELAVLAAERFEWVERSARAALCAAHVARRLLGERGTAALERTTRRWTGRSFPASAADLPRPAPRLPETASAGATAVIFPSCVSRVASGADDGIAALVRVLRRAGLRPWIPRDVVGHCCGMPFSSKGYARAHVRSIERTVRALWSWSDGGRLPVVVDGSPCALTLVRAAADLAPPLRARFEQLRIQDGVGFAHDEVLPRLTPRPLRGRVALHPACSARRMELTGKLLRVGQACAEEASIPIHAGCCGFAGDRGFLFPELTAAATRPLAAEARVHAPQGAYGSSRTCEIGLSRALGLPCRSFWSLLDQATR